jgi:hypothetical protein
MLQRASDFEGLLRATSGKENGHRDLATLPVRSLYTASLLTRAANEMT